MPLVQSFEEACQIKGIAPEKVLPDVSALPERIAKAVLATTKLMIIQEVVTEGWKPDWEYYAQKKWFPWFVLNGEFLFNDALYDEFASKCGSRFCFRSEEEAIHVGKTFAHLYKDLMVID